MQKKPNFNYKDDETSSTKNGSSSPAAPPLSQTWQKSGSCPEGTVAIRRTRREDLLRAASLEHLGRDGPQQTSSASNTTHKSGRFVYLNNETKVEISEFAGHSVILKAS